jgi:hypothetical protein
MPASLRTILKVSFPLSLMRIFPSKGILYGGRCYRYPHQPSIFRGWEYLKRICVPYNDIHTNVRFLVRASNKLLVSGIFCMETCFLVSSLPAIQGLNSFIRHSLKFINERSASRGLLRRPTKSSIRFRSQICACLKELRRPNAVSSALS